MTIAIVGIMALVNSDVGAPSSLLNRISEWPVNPITNRVGINNSPSPIGDLRPGRESGSGAWHASRIGPNGPYLHQGIDLAASIGTAVHASLAGIVLLNGSYSGYGNTLVIEHKGFGFTLYAHLQAPSGLGLTAPVGRGQIVAFTGASGLSADYPSGEYHLHFGFKAGAIFNIGGTDYDSPTLFLRGDFTLR